MKKLFILFAVCVIAVSCAKEPKFIVTGTITGAEDGQVLLQKRIAGGFSVIDSALLTNGTFKMEGFIEYPQMVMLSLKDRRGGLNFFIENAEINITGFADSLYQASVTGSKTQSEYETYIASFDELNNERRKVFDRYREARMAGNEELAATIEKEMQAMDDKQLEMNKEFIINNPASYVTPVVLSDPEILYRLEGSDMEALLSKLDTTLNKVQAVADMKERLVHLKAVAVGQKAPDFTLNDVNGNPVSLYSKIGGGTKILLVDFWASWCGPCRRENPNIVKVWKEYNKKGFNVFGVSLDTQEDAWKKGIEEDQLTWTHVSDLKRFNTSPVNLYAVIAIPSNFLLDENGIIIGHNVMGDDLAAKVKEILGKK
jgi:peroxiredoxin